MSEKLKISRCPNIVIDASYIYFHRADEFHSLLKEIMLTYSVCKKYCDEYRIVISYPYRDQLTEELFNHIKRTKIMIIERSLEGTLSLINSTRPLYLDPYSSKDLDPLELYYYDTVILGGVVDKPPRKRLTTSLIQMNLPWVDSRRITLRGSLAGVASNINIIAEILLRTLLTGDLERSIRETQPKREAMVRAHIEIMRKKDQLKTREDIERLYRELAQWLNLDVVTFRRALKRSGVSRELWI
ncbi:MAG: hypothetical protein ACP5I7_02940 [Sulfolobales archaeon]